MFRDGTNNGISYHIKRETDISAGDLLQFRSFVRDEISNCRTTPKDLQPQLYKERIQSALIHSFALKEINQTLVSKLPASLIFALNRQEELTGYSLVLLNLSGGDEVKQAGPSFLGVKEGWQHQGIGTRLLEIRIEELRKLGITRYVTNARWKAIDLYGKLGLHYEASPLSENDFSGMHLVVDLSTLI